MPPHARYDRVATSYSRYRPRYPDVLVERFREDRARDELRGLRNRTVSNRTHVAFGYRFTCLTARRHS